MNIFRKIREKRQKGWNEVIEALVVEKLSQLENGELDTVSGKYLAEKMSKEKWCIEIYENYKNKNKK